MTIGYQSIIRMQGANMMRYSKFLVFLVPVLALTACKDSGVTDLGTPAPKALVRFINAVPDTGTVDFRFIDKVENLPTLQGVAFRASSGMYQRAEEGARHARIFPNSYDVNLTQIMLVDTTVNLAVSTHYTLVYTGRATSNQDRLAVITDDPAPTVPAGKIAIALLHAMVGTGAVDVYITPATATANNADPIANAVASFKNIGYLSKGAYALVPTRPTTGETVYQFTVTAAGSTTPIFTVRINQPGV